MTEAGNSAIRSTALKISSSVASVAPLFVWHYTLFPYLGRREVASAWEGLLLIGGVTAFLFILSYRYPRIVLRWFLTEIAFLFSYSVYLLAAYQAEFASLLSASFVLTALVCAFIVDQSVLLVREKRGDVRR